MENGIQNGIQKRFVFVPFLGDFFSIIVMSLHSIMQHMVFVPFLGDFFSIISISKLPELGKVTVFVPFLGDFFSIACLRSPSPSALASAFAAGMGGIASSGTLLRR